MIQVKINDDDRRYAVEILKTKKFGHRSRGFNGSYEKQYTGLIGELTLFRLIGKPQPNYESGRLDEDININGKKVDIKSMARNVYMQEHYVHNFVAYQKDMPSDVLLFISINKRSGIVQICGWLEKENPLKKFEWGRNPELVVGVVGIAYGLTTRRSGQAEKVITAASTGMLTVYAYKQSLAMGS